MLTDAKLQAISKNKKFENQKIPDKNGLYIKVLPSGRLSFRWDFYMGGRGSRRGTCTFGLYPAVSLKEARAMLEQAKLDVANGIDPSRKKIQKRQAYKASGTFDEWWMSYLAQSQIADSTKSMRLAVYNRDMKKRFGNLKLSEIHSEDVRALCDKIVARGAPSVAVHARDIVLQVFKWARMRGEQVENPAEDVPPTSIAKFRPRERALSPDEIGIALKCFDYVGANLAVKAGAKLLLLTFVRKSELAQAEWSEVDFERETWTIPAERMKKRAAHVVPLSGQALDLLVALKSLSGGSKYVLPSRYDSSTFMSNATFNRFFDQVCTAANERGMPLAHFGPHDLRRTASTILHEEGFASDWIEKQLAHEQRGVRAVYNKAQYLTQRREMMQTWADLVTSYELRARNPKT